MIFEPPLNPTQNPPWLQILTEDTFGLKFQAYFTLKAFKENVAVEIHIFAYNCNLLSEITSYNWAIVRDT